jgi:hypothetical protein
MLGWKEIYVIFYKLIIDVIYSTLISGLQLHVITSHFKRF